MNTILTIFTLYASWISLLNIDAIKGYTELLNTTRVDLKSYLEIINNKLNNILS